MITKIWSEKFRLDEKIVVVTGAGLIGSELIKGLAESGAKVIISEINEQIGKSLEAKLKSINLDVVFNKIDITNEKSVINFIEKCVSKFNKIDGWINTAYPRTHDWGNKEQLLNFESWKKNIDMHLGGYCLTSIKAAELMKEQMGGSIVNLSSIYGINAPDYSIYKDTEMNTPIVYPVIKGGINMATKYIASYYGQYNVRANTIVAGGVFNNQPEQFVSNYIKKTCLKRMANPEDFVGPAIFLISDASSYLTGQNLIVDGGWTVI